MIGFVVLGYAILLGQQRSSGRHPEQGRLPLDQFPKFVLGFLLISALASVGFFTKPGLLAIGNLSRWAFLLTFAGVGLRTNFRDLSKQGLRPFLVGAIGEVAIAAVTLALVFTADRLFHL